MHAQLHFQDPTSDRGRYLFEVLVESLQKAVSARGVFAFASPRGVQFLLNDPDVAGFLRRGEMLLAVGIDAVTDKAALLALQEHEERNPRLQVRVFANPTTALFHPKLFHVEMERKRHRMIVGSGNLTPGGLRDNFEAFLVLDADGSTDCGVSELEKFFAAHSQDLRPIDSEILEFAAKNTIAAGSRRATRAVESPPTRNLPRAQRIEYTDVLIAEVPRAGDRWHQVHFNADVVGNFFQVEPNSSERVFLQVRDAGGAYGEPEPPRKVVMSHRNLNQKIEFGARHGEPYPLRGRPLLIVKRIQRRSFEYALLFPTDPGHAEALEILDATRSIGRGVRRAILDAARVLREWPSCPVLRDGDAGDGTRTSEGG